MVLQLPLALMRICLLSRAGHSSTFSEWLYVCFSLLSEKSKYHNLLTAFNVCQTQLALSELHLWNYWCGRLLNIGISQGALPLSLGLAM